MDHLHCLSPVLALTLSALMTSKRCGKTDNFPPRARPLRVATFCSSGRTWVGFLLRTHGTSFKPTSACQSPPHSIPFSSSSLAHRVIVLPPKILSPLFE